MASSQELSMSHLKAKGVINLSGKGVSAGVVISLKRCREYCKTVTFRLG